MMPIASSDSVIRISHRRWEADHQPCFHHRRRCWARTDCWAHSRTKAIQKTAARNQKYTDNSHRIFNAWDV